MSNISDLLFIKNIPNKSQDFDEIMQNSRIFSKVNTTQKSVSYGN